MRQTLQDKFINKIKRTAIICKGDHTLKYKYCCSRLSYQIYIYKNN